MDARTIDKPRLPGSTEPTTRSHRDGAMRSPAGCDRSLQGAMLARLRLKMPAVVLYGGYTMSDTSGMTAMVLETIGLNLPDSAGGTAEVVCHAHI
jgi:dihydroxyacid dehydratase/phosphogluconate dehydratase